MASSCSQSRSVTQSVVGRSHARMYINTSLLHGECPTGKALSAQYALQHSCSVTSWVYFLAQAPYLGVDSNKHSADWYCDNTALQPLGGLNVR